MGFRKVPVEVEYTELENDYGKCIPGIRVHCSKCGNWEESFGQEEGSIKRCCVLLSQSCKGVLKHFYVVE